MAARVQDAGLPLRLTSEIKIRFHVSHIEVRYASGPKAVLHPKAGGFVVSTCIPRSKGRDFRFVVAHEFAHTFFYRYNGPDRVPTRVDHPFEEALCEYGARAMLIPRPVLNQGIRQDFCLNEILRLAATCDAYPLWVARRLFVDLELQEGAFFIYYGFGEHLRKIDGVHGLHRPLTGQVLAGLRCLVKGLCAGDTSMQGSYYLGKPGSGARFEVEIRRVQEKQQSLFCDGTQFYILLRPTR